MAKINKKFGELTLGNKISPPNVIDGLQGVLDVAGLAPGVGAAFDLANAGIYYLRGDYVNAATSAFSAIPGVGDAATVAKFANKGIKITQKVQKVQGKTKKMSQIDAQKTPITKLKEIWDNVKNDLDDFANKQLDELQEQLAIRTNSQIETYNNITKGLEGKIKNVQEITHNVRSQYGKYINYNGTNANIIRPWK